MREWLIRLVARMPATVQTKLLAAFLAMVVLLLTLGAVGLQTLSRVNRRAEELVRLQTKDAAYRGLQYEALTGTIAFSGALMAASDRPAALGGELQVLLDQANRFRDRIHAWRSVAEWGFPGRPFRQFHVLEPEEEDWFSQIQSHDDELIKLVTRAVDRIRVGKVDEGRKQLVQAAGLADQIESITGQLVVFSDARLAAGFQQNRAAYVTSQWVVIGLAAGSIGLAFFLGYVISWSLIVPVKRMDAQLRQITSGDFSHRSQVPNRDELGALAANLNHMSEELGRLYQELEAASRHKSQFLANMSHELRTPLNAILGYTELILDNIYGEVPDKIREVLERVQRSGRHLLNLINDVLDLSKIEAGQLVLSLDDYSMTDIVQTVSTAVQSLAAEKHLGLRVAVPPDLPRGKGDERRITQVLLNLVGNAIKFTESGEVAIRAMASDGQFLVAVSDTGPGIPEHDQQKIFEEFQQGDSSSTRQKGGTGLGLSIARRIVELHRGRMWVESSPGRGSTFWFSLPVTVERSVS
jgi:signal transduction histidine kinase